MTSQKRGATRKHNPHIPAHINQDELPTGLYFDHRGRGRWYTLYMDEMGIQRSQFIAKRDVTQDELQRLMDERQGIQRKTLRFLCDRFHASPQFKMLMQHTKNGYEYCRKSVTEIPTKTGAQLGDLMVDRLSPPLIQRIVDRMASAGTPTKANSVLRYLRRLFRWGINRGHCQSNPALGVESAKERKRRRLPGTALMERTIEYAREHACDFPKRGQAGTCPAYMWIVMELAYLCRLRGIEVVTLTDANALEEGVMTNRRKGSRDNIVRWTPRLRYAWDMAVERRTQLWACKSRETPKLPEDRYLIVAKTGEPLRKTALDSSWKRFIALLLREEIIHASQRFGLHDLKRQGITDTPGTRYDKQEASGHRSSAMMDIYDLSIPLVSTPETTKAETKLE